MRRLVTCMVLAVSVGLALVPTAGAWSWPLQGSVLRPFALGSDPYAGGQHRGVDVEGAAGEGVRAPAGGTVTFAGTVPTHGRVVTILTSDGYAVTLAHLGELAVAKGAVVAEGDRVGEAGASGTPEHPGAYVHLGIRVAAEEHGYVDPLSFLPSRPVVTRSAPATPQPVAAGPASPPATTPVTTPWSPADSPAQAGPGGPQQTVSEPVQAPAPTPPSTAPTAPTGTSAPGGAVAATTAGSASLAQDSASRRPAPATGVLASSSPPVPEAEGLSRGGQLHTDPAAALGVPAVARPEPAARPRAEPGGGRVAVDAGSRLALPVGGLAVDGGDAGTSAAVEHAQASAVAGGHRGVRSGPTTAADSGATPAAAAPLGARAHTRSPGAETGPRSVAAPPGLPAARSAERHEARGSGHAATSDPLLDEGTAAAAAVVAGERAPAWLGGAGASVLLLALIGLVVARRAATSHGSPRGGAWARA